MRASARTIRDRLLVAAGLAVAACGSSSSGAGTSSTEATGAGGDSSTGGTSAAAGMSAAGTSSAGTSSAGTSSAGTTGAAGDTGAAGTSANGGTGGSESAGAGGSIASAGSAGASAGSGGYAPTPSCHMGLACAGDEWCAYPSGPPMPPFGSPSTDCECQSGAFVCGGSLMLSAMPTICYVNDGGGTCLADADPSLTMRLRERFDTSCPGIGGPMNGMAAIASDGTPECCYTVSLLACAGRPIAIAGSSRVASLSRRRDWG